jgi:hypothetical protein
MGEPLGENRPAISSKSKSRDILEGRGPAERPSSPHFRRVDDVLGGKAKTAAEGRAPPRKR